MRRLRPLLLAPLVLAIGAAPDPHRTWYSIVNRDGAVIGFGYSSEGGVQYREATVRRADGSVMRVTDRIVTTVGEYARTREIFQRIDVGGEWAEYRSTVGVDEAVITRTTAAGRQTARVKVPSERLYNPSMFAPGRCPSIDPPYNERFELAPTAMGLERIVTVEAPPRGSENPISAQHYRGDRLHRVDQYIYDGDCRLTSFVTTFGGVEVTVRYTDGNTAPKTR